MALSLLCLQPEEVAQEAAEEPLIEPLMEPEGESYEESPQVRGARAGGALGIREDCHHAQLGLGGPR